MKYLGLHCHTTDSDIHVVNDEGVKAFTVKREYLSDDKWDCICDFMVQSFNSKKVVKGYHIIEELLIGKTAISIDGSKVFTFKFNRQNETMTISVNGVHGDEFANDMVVEVYDDKSILLFTPAGTNNSTHSYKFKLYELARQI